MSSNTVRTASGRTLDELNIEALCADEVTAEDFRISGQTLHRQADAAEAAGYRQLAENLRRAAELTRVSNDQVFEIYDVLRPGRATYAELVALADRLEGDLDAPLIATLVREAAETYLERGLVAAGPRKASAGDEGKEADYVTRAGLGAVWGIYDLSRTVPGSRSGAVSAAVRSPSLSAATSSAAWACWKSRPVAVSTLRV